MAATLVSTAEIRPVPLLAPVAGAGFGLVLLALLVADLPLPIRLTLLGCLGVASAGMAAELRRAARPRSVAWDGNGGWWLDGRPVRIAPATRVYPWLVVLVLRGPPAAGPHRRAGTHWVPRFAVDPDAFRRLKAQLRHGRTAPAGKRPQGTPC